MFSKRARLWLGLIVAVSLLSLASSCKPKTEEGSGETPTAGTTPPPSKGDEGTITGKITYTGTAPEPIKIDTAADNFCTQKTPNLTNEVWVVKDGKVANTFVYIKDGTIDGAKKVSEYTWPAPSTPVVLDQSGCHYKPHVLGVVVNQEISITNSDQTQHNIHFTPLNNPEWNQSQVSGAPPLSHKLARAEILVPVKCNQHPWMHSYVGVLKHPFFAVSSDDGSFTIKGVPPGKYTVVAWHEGGAKGTEKTTEVTVPAKGAATADFTFGASADLRGQPSSLQMMPALEVPMIGRH